MSSPLRARVALFILMAIFLIPIGLSSLRGLTHILTCSERAATPFTIIIPADGPPQLTSSTRITAGGTQDLCGGLGLDMQAGGEGSARVRMVVSITNNTDLAWRGTVGLVLEGDRTASVPIDIGAIEPGATVSDEIVFRNLPQGTHQLNGRLLIGP